MPSQPALAGLPTMTDNLSDLLQKGHRYRTILADPPWSYSNRASRGAASNHYSTLTLNQIQAEPVKHLVENSAHLHLWTTNAFLESSFAVMRSWGFEYKSCLVWVKPQMGMGNYWRVSHEFLLFGTRGKPTFGRNDIQSWVLAPRTKHSVKPFRFRELTEAVSPGPYLELYGRVEQPNTGWTVYGNEIERRLF